MFIFKFHFINFSFIKIYRLYYLIVVTFRINEKIFNFTYLCPRV